MASKSSNPYDELLDEQSLLKIEKKAEKQRKIDQATAAQKKSAKSHDDKSLDSSAAANKFTPVIDVTRPEVRVFDKQSGTGRGKEVSKQGHKGWGKSVDQNELKEIIEEETNQLNNKPKKEKKEPLEGQFSDPTPIQAQVPTQALLPSIISPRNKTQNKDNKETKVEEEKKPENKVKDVEPSKEEQNNPEQQKKKSDEVADTTDQKETETIKPEKDEITLEEYQKKIAGQKVHLKKDKKNKERQAGEGDDNSQLKGLVLIHAPKGVEQENKKKEGKKEKENKKENEKKEKPNQLKDSDEKDITNQVFEQVRLEQEKKQQFRGRGRGQRSDQNRNGDNRPPRNNGPKVDETKQDAPANAESTPANVSDPKVSGTSDTSASNTKPQQASSGPDYNTGRGRGRRSYDGQQRRGPNQQGVDGGYYPITWRPGDPPQTAHIATQASQSSSSNAPLNNPVAEVDFPALKPKGKKTQTLV